LLQLDGAAIPPVQLAPGARSTLFVPVSARDGFGDGQVNATISGLSLPGETFAPMQKQWKIGVRPAFPAQTVNSGAVLQPGKLAGASGQTQGSRRRRCRASWCSAASRR
jgi:uncharacterized protein YfaS (alpha-2-macroglobulin family)